MMSHHEVRQTLARLSIGGGEQRGVEDRPRGVLDARDRPLHHDPILPARTPHPELSTGQFRCEATGVRRRRR